MSGSQNQMLDAFAQMTEAVRKVPEMEAEIERLKRDLDFCIKERDVAKTHQDDLAHRNDELASKVTSLEVERDEYGFRNLELSDKLEKVYSLAGSLLAQAKPPVEPVKEPEAKVLDGGIDGPYNEPIRPQGQSEIHPTANTASAQFNVDSTDSANIHQTSPSADGQRDSGESASMMEVPSPAAATTSEGITGSNTEGNQQSEHHTSSTDRPNADRPYWFKPATMTWREWDNSGGELPGWVVDLDSVF